MNKKAYSTNDLSARCNAQMGIIMRNNKMDNIKALLICSVVLGHLLELSLDRGVNRLFYMIIYSFHMPMFVYVSGYFASFQWKKFLQKIVWPYALFQILYILFANYVLGKNLAIQWSKPYWIMWYLFAMILWFCTLPFIRKIHGKKRYGLLAAVILVAVVVGYFNEIGRAYSLSRAFVFYPFFLMGYYEGNPAQKMENLAEKSKNWILPICIGVLVTAFLYGLFHYKEMGIYWMYEAASYETDKITPLYRSCHMLIAYSWIKVLKSVITQKCYPRIVQIGQNTMPIYLMHGFVIKWMDKYEIFQNIRFKLVVFILLMFALVFFFSSHIVGSFFQRLLFGKPENKQK